LTKKLRGKQGIVDVNFPPNQIVNFFSEYFVLGVEDNEGNVLLVQPKCKVENRIRIRYGFKTLKGLKRKK